MYLGWKCNHRCIFCNERQNIEQYWQRKISNKEILAKLLKYKKQGYNHVTFLGGEPFSQENFGYAIRAAKTLGYTLLVTTNGTLLQFERIARQTVPFIDELIISIHSANPEKQMAINRSQSALDLHKIFSNSAKYFRGNFIKINTVLNHHNYQNLEPIIKLAQQYEIKEIALTYPDIAAEVRVNQAQILLRYSELLPYLKKAYQFCQRSGINLKIADIPLCCLGRLWELADDLVYDNRMKLSVESEQGVKENSGKEKELDRKKILPRARRHIKKCDPCTMKDRCWGPAIAYVEEFYDDSEIKPIKR